MRGILDAVRKDYGVIVRVNVGGVSELGCKQKGMKMGEGRARKCGKLD